MHVLMTARTEETSLHLIQLEGDEDAQCPCDPEGAVDEEEDLRPALAGVGGQPHMRRLVAGPGGWIGHTMLYWYFY